MPLNQSPRRRAILIATQGQKNKYLYGVNVDIHNLNYFLQSDQGGKWYQNEITILNNPSICEVKSELIDFNFDYQMIYYSGHGYHVGNSQYLCLRDGDLKENELVLKNTPRQTLIFDACRNFVQAPRPRMPLNGIGTGDIVEHFTGSPTRGLMDEYILESPNGLQVAYATLQGYSARDTHFGGWFTSNLMQLSRNLGPLEGEISYITLDALIDRIDPLEIDRHRSIYQIPEFQNVSGDLHIPFAFGF